MLPVPKPNSNNCRYRNQAKCRRYDWSGILSSHSNQNEIRRSLATWWATEGRNFFKCQWLTLSVSDECVKFVNICCLCVPGNADKACYRFKLTKKGMDGSYVYGIEFKTEKRAKYCLSQLELALSQYPRAMSLLHVLSEREILAYVVIHYLSSVLKALSWRLWEEVLATADSTRPPYYTHHVIYWMKLSNWSSIFLRELTVAVYQVLVIYFIRNM